MDTRDKIVDWEKIPELVRQGHWQIVAGRFDPLTALQAQRLARFSQDGRQLLVVIQPHEESLLTTGARAALVAGLRGVAAVTVCPHSSWRSAFDPSLDIEITEDEEGERRRSADFVEFVLGRHQQAQTPAEENR